jgi:hypothetical protein
MVAVLFQPPSCHVANIIVAFLNMVAVLFQPPFPTRMGISPAIAYLATSRLETMFLYMFQRSGSILHNFEFHTRFSALGPWMGMKAIARVSLKPILKSTA